MNKIESICKWLACNYVENFDVEGERFIICGYDMTACIAVIASYNEYGVPICNLISFNDDWDDESIDNCEFVSMDTIPNPLVESIDNGFKLFSIVLEDFMNAVWLGGQNYGINLFWVHEVEKWKNNS